jgi:hypothetical protein
MKIANNNPFFKIGIIKIIAFISLYTQITLVKIAKAQIENKCTNVLNEITQSNLNLIQTFQEQNKNTRQNSNINQISEMEIITHTLKGLTLVPEFNFIRGAADKLGIRVWLFGGTASSFLHYIKWDLARSKGLLNLQNQRFDYDYTNIFRSTQDLDIVVDAKPEVAIAFQNIISDKFPHFLGEKAKWEVRTLHHPMKTIGEIGFKEALLDDPDFNNQNTDSNSLGMVEITLNKKESPIRDLKHWDSPTSLFLEDTLKNKISFLRSPLHFTTARAISGENPEILSVIRILVKAFQYELTFSKTDFDEMKTIINQFEARQVNNATARHRILDTARKLVLHAVNIEYAINKLDELGLRKKLIEMDDKTRLDSSAWWLNREPLRSFPIGRGQGRTAAELNLKVVAHETNSFLAYESITRSHSGEPNALISRKNSAHEEAYYGDGFYTRIGKEGARGTGLTIRFNIAPEAREGTDFIIEGEFLIFKNKKALSVIQESLNFGIDDLIKLAESNQDLEFDQSNLALLEKIKRKLNVSIINDELNKLLNSQLKIDHQRLLNILFAFQNSGAKNLLDKDTLESLVKNIYNKVAHLTNSNSEIDILRYLQTISPIFKICLATELIKSDSFYDYISNLILNPKYSFEFRKQAFFVFTLLPDFNYDRLLKFRNKLPAKEFKIITSEIKTWAKSQDINKLNLIFDINTSWSHAIKYNWNGTIQHLNHSSLFDINNKNLSEVSILQLAAYYRQPELINWLITNPEFDINIKNKYGFTEVEQLQLSGKSELAAEILKKRPDAISRNIETKERNNDGSPIIDFVKVEPNSFLMGEDNKKVITHILTPFEIMSIPITNETFKTVVELLIEKYPSAVYRTLIYSITTDFTQSIHVHPLPKVFISHNDASLWNQGLSELSSLPDPKV